MNKINNGFLYILSFFFIYTIVSISPPTRQKSGSRINKIMKEIGKKINSR